MAKFSGVAAGGFAQGLNQGAQLAQSAQIAKLQQRQAALQDFQSLRTIMAETDPALRDATLNQWFNLKGVDPKDPGIKNLKDILAKGDEKTLEALRNSALQGALQGLPLSTQLKVFREQPLALIELKRKMDDTSTLNNVLFGGATPGPVSPGVSPDAADQAAAPSGLPGAPVSAPGGQASPSPVSGMIAQPQAGGFAGAPVSGGVPGSTEARIADLRRRAQVAAALNKPAAVAVLQKEMEDLQRPGRLADERAATLQASMDKERAMLPLEVQKQAALAAQKARSETAASTKPVETLTKKLRQMVNDSYPNITPGNRLTEGAKMAGDIKLQTNKELVKLDALVRGSLSQVIRFFGEKGTLTDTDIARARALSIQTFPIPDTREVALGKLDQLDEFIAELNGRPAPNSPGGAAAPSGPVVPATNLDQFFLKPPGK